MYSSKNKSRHHNDDDSMPQIRRVGESSNMLKYSIVQPFAHISCVRSKHDKKRYGNGGKWEPMGTMKERILEIPRFAYGPEKIEESYTVYDKKTIVPDRGVCVFFFLPDKNSGNHNSYEKMQSKNKRIVCWKPFAHNAI